MSESLVGQWIGSVQIERKLQELSTGVVWWEGHDSQSQALRWVLCLAPELAENEYTQQQWTERGNALKNFHHRYVLSLVDVVSHQGNGFLIYEAMPEAGTLAECRGKLEPSQWSKLFSGLGEAVEASREISAGEEPLSAFCELRPDCIFVAAEQDTVLFRWLCIPRVEMDSQQQETKAGSTPGTVRYLSPEVLKGQPKTAESDFFTLGAMLVETITGEDAFAGESLTQLLENVIQGDSRALSAAALSKDVHSLVEALLQPDPALRLTSAEDLTERLQGSLAALNDRVLSEAEEEEDELFDRMEPPKEPTSSRFDAMPEEPESPRSSSFDAMPEEPTSSRFDSMLDEPESPRSSSFDAMPEEPSSPRRRASARKKARKSAKKKSKQVIADSTRKETETDSASANELQSSAESSLLEGIIPIIEPKSKSSSALDGLIGDLFPSGSSSPEPQEPSEDAAPPAPPAGPSLASRAKAAPPAPAAPPPAVPAAPVPAPPPPAPAPAAPVPQPAAPAPPAPKAPAAPAPAPAAPAPAAPVPQPPAAPPAPAPGSVSLVADSSEEPAPVDEFFGGAQLSPEESELLSESMPPLSTEFGAGGASSDLPASPSFDDDAEFRSTAMYSLSPADLIGQRGAPWEEDLDQAQEGMEAEEIEVKTLRRKGVVRSYTQMNPGKIFPLLVSIVESELYIKVPDLPQVQQVESDNVMEIKESSPYVKIVPVIPGCIVSPPEAVVDVRQEKVDVEFWIAPQSEGDLTRSARIQLWHEDLMKDEIPIPCRVVTQTLTRIASYSSVLSSVSGAALETYGQQLAPKVNATGPETSSLVSWLLQNFVALLTSSGIWLGLFFLLTAFLCYLWLRPKRGDVIERFLTTELH